MPDGVCNPVRNLCFRGYAKHCRTGFCIAGRGLLLPYCRTGFVIALLPDGVCNPVRQRTPSGREPRPERKTFYSLTLSTYLFISRMVVETITQTLIMTRKAGTHTYSWYGWVSLATEIPTMPNRKIRNIKTITKKHAGSESYQGIITFLYKGFGSSCIIIASYHICFKKIKMQKLGVKLRANLDNIPHFHCFKKSPLPSGGIFTVSHRQTLRTGLQTPSGGRQTLRTWFPLPDGGIFTVSHRQTLRTGLQTPSGGKNQDAEAWNEVRDKFG